jgi:hypothetical protein
MSNNAGFDASIPVLTEVFQDQPVKKEVREEPAEPAAAAPVEVPAADQSPAPDWAALERRLAERIMQQMEGEVESALEQRLRDSIAAAVELAMDGLASELRASLQQTVEKIVVRAVAEELAQLQPPGK